MEESRGGGEREDMAKSRGGREREVCVCVVHVRVVCVCVQTRADAPVLSASDSISALFRRDLFSNNFYFTNSL